MQSSVSKILEERGVEEANKIVHGGKKHSSSYLIGRLSKKRCSKEKTGPSPVCNSSDQFLVDLTAKIREQLSRETEEKVDRKVRDNVKLMMSKIAEKNPELKVDIDELTAEPSIDHSNDNVST